MNTQLKTQINYRKHESPLHIPQRMTTSASPQVGNNPGTKGSNTPLYDTNNDGTGVTCDPTYGSLATLPP